MPNHIVQQGECLARIAAHYGFRDYRTVYDDPGNAELRELRPDPNLLFPGDIVYIPDKRQKKTSGPTTMVHKFRIRGTRRKLRIVVEDLSGKPMASEPYELIVEGETIQGTTDPDGLIEQWIPMSAEEGKLTIRKYVWPLAIAHLNPTEETDDDGISGIQARLRNLGYNPGKIDGILGPRTEAAVVAFQADHPPLEVDGICGPQTKAKLIELYGC